MKNTRAMFGIIAGGAGVLMLIGVMQLFSQLYLYQAEKFMAQWQIGQPASPELISETIKVLAHAEKLAVVTNPRIYQVSGLLSEWQGGWSRDPQQASVFYQLALENYQRQAKAVPGWPYPWINQLRMLQRLASLESHQAEILDRMEWQQAWDESIYFAQRHSQVSLALAKELNLLWPLLNRVEQQQALGVMITSVSASSAQARQLMRGITNIHLKTAVCLSLRAQQLNDFGQCV
jgi:hypothetical protein